MVAGIYAEDSTSRISESSGREPGLQWYKPMANCGQAQRQEWKFDEQLGH